MENISREVVRKAFGSSKVGNSSEFVSREFVNHCWSEHVVRYFSFSAESNCYGVVKSMYRILWERATSIRLIAGL